MAKSVLKRVRGQAWGRAGESPLFETDVCPNAFELSGLTLEPGVTAEIYAVINIESKKAVFHSEIC